MHHAFPRCRHWPISLMFFSRTYCTRCRWPIILFCFFPVILIQSYQRKFRSQTSDNMDRWKAEMGRVREEKRRKKIKQKRESFRRKKIPGARKGKKVAKHKVFLMICGRKVGSLKRWVRSQLARWEMKNCTPLWREAHFEVKMYKAPQCRTTFGSWDVQKVHAVLARSTFRSQNVQNTPGPDQF